MNTNSTKPAASPHRSSLSLLKRIMRDYLRHHIGKLALAIFFMTISAAMTAAVAKLLQPIMDEVLGGDDTSMIIPFAAIVMVVFVIRGLSTYAHTVLMNKVSQTIIGQVQKDLFNHFMRMDLGFFHTNPSGQLISRVTNDVTMMRSAVANIVTDSGKGVMTLVFLVAVMFSQDFMLSLCAFTVFPVLAAFVIYLGKRLRKISRNLQGGMADLTDKLSQIFQGIRQVQAYGMEEHEKTRAAQSIDQVRKLNIKSVQIGNLSTPVNEILAGLIFFSIITYGGYQVKEGIMTTGQLISFLGAFIMAQEPLKRLAKLNNVVQTGLGASERVFEMMDLVPSITPPKRGQKWKDKTPDVTFKDVTFTYETGEDKALHGVSFTAKSGKVTALVGPSGSGKSTIMNMIPRFYDPSGGTVSIGKIDVKKLDLPFLRNNIALVSQDITIFDDTIANNIAYGKHGATQEEIFAAAKAAAAHEFIEAMPHGYDTIVGEDGVKLSGGQRQRVAIARAILRNAPILLLDEATSALDNESEKLVQQALKSLEKGRTTIVIAHRLSTVKNADSIIVLDRGQIAEQGTHEALLKQDGLYAKMHKTGLKG